MSSATASDDINAESGIPPEPVDEVTLIEQRRKRREAIKAKYRGQATPLLVQALQLGTKTESATSNLETLNASNDVSGKGPAPTESLD
jgi:serine/threonine-protein kinase PRP4